MKKIKRILAFIGAAILAVLAYLFGFNNSEVAGGDDPSTIVVEQPSNTSFSESEALMELPSATPGAKILRHSAYTSSYNSETLLPDWVAYELTEEETEGRLGRDGIEFRMDPDLKRTRQAMREDYSNSGWTKGHMMPAADAAFDGESMSETFYLTNICPQSEELNAGDWQFLEKRVRQLARQYGRVWVVTGPIVGENRYGTIGDREVVVPDSFYKALLIKKDSGANGGYSAIAFVMGNDDGRYYLKDCAMSVNGLEAMTGLDFFPALDDAYEEKVEGQFKLSDWGISK